MSPTPVPWLCPAVPLPLCPGFVQQVSRPWASGGGVMSVVAAVHPSAAAPWGCCASCSDDSMAVQLCPRPPLHGCVNESLQSLRPGCVQQFPLPLRTVCVQQLPLPLRHGGPAAPPYTVIPPHCLLPPLCRNTESTPVSCAVSLRLIFGLMIPNDIHKPFQLKRYQERVFQFPAENSGEN